MNDREDEHKLDDEALNWDGDDDVVRGDEPEEDEKEAKPKRGIFDVVREMSGAERVTAALFVVVSIAWAVGWGIVVGQNPIWIPNMVISVMYELGEFLAIIASPLAVFTVAQLARGRARLMWLIGVIVVTFPWPLVLEGIA